MAAITRWFIDNPIAAKLLMLVIILAGLLSYPVIPKIMFPESEIDMIRVTVAYPGAGPAEVEEQVTRRIEEAVEQLGGIEEVRSVSREGVSQVTIEAEPQVDIQGLLNDVRANVDAITTFPTSAERPQIVEQRFSTIIMRLQLAGSISERELKELGESVREEIAELPDADIIRLGLVRDYEVSIEVSEKRLAEYGVDFNQLATAIRSYSFDLPVGKIRDSGGDVQLQARAQADAPQDFANIPVLRKLDGSVIRVGDLATVVDGFADTDMYSRLNGKRALELEIVNQTNPDILTISRQVKDYVARKQSELPDSVELIVLSDLSVSYQGRLDTLIKNGSGGLLLVFLLLMFFLRPILAFWVCGGIAVAFMGAMWGMSFTTVSLNVLSMFSFIMILGIVVDDAIVIGESVYFQQELLGDKRRGAIEGVRLMLTPVAFAVVSTIIFFIPFFFFDIGLNTAHIAIPVTLALLFSLVESFFLLPSHLAHQRYTQGEGKEPIGIWLKLAAIWKSLTEPFRELFFFLQSALEKIRKPVADSMPRFAQTVYRRWLIKSLVRRWQTLLLFVIALSCSVATFPGGWLSFNFFPRVTADFVYASAVLPESSAYSESVELMERMEKAGKALQQEINESYGREIIENIASYAIGNQASVFMILESSSDRPVSAHEISRKWRTGIGELYGVTDFSIRFTLFQIPKPLGFDLRSNNQQQLEGFTRELLQYLREQEGIFDARSSLEHASSEINFELNPGAEALNISLQDIARQIRQAFYGEEVQRIPREREDVKVFVRYPRQDRSYEEALLDMKIQGPQQERVPLNAVVDTVYRSTYKRYDHLDGLRVSRVTADVHRGYSAQTLGLGVNEFAVRELIPKYPEVRVNLAGEEQERQEFMDELTLYFSVAILAIYALMAIIFRSYGQPLLVLMAIPFGFIGGIFGHVLMGVNLSMFSTLGMLACAGVVVNDNVVLIDRINHLRSEGMTPRNAVVTAGVQRFRPIVLTSLTTFLGLMPILLESSVQAQFLIPMVISLSFGVLCATWGTLIFTPCLYLMGDSLMRKLGVDRNRVVVASMSARSRHSV